MIEKAPLIKIISVTVVSWEPSLKIFKRKIAMSEKLLILRILIRTQGV